MDRDPSLKDSASSRLIPEPHSAASRNGAERPDVSHQRTGSQQRVALVAVGVLAHVAVVPLEVAS